MMNWRTLSAVSFSTFFLIVRSRYFVFLCLSVYEIVIDLENFRKSFGYKCALCVVLHSVRIDENAFRRIIGGEHDTVSVGDLSPFAVTVVS